MNYHIASNLTATGGVRYSHERRAIKGTVSAGLVREPGGPLTDFGDVSFESWTPRLALRYEFANNSNIYFSYSKGFKSGGYDVVSILGATGELVPVLPEKLTAYEIGVKSAPSRTLDLALSAFYYDYTNQQVTTFVDQGGAVVGVTRNAAASEIFGADFQGTLRATDELSFRTGVSVLHARFVDYPSAIVTTPAFGNVNGVLTGIGNTQVNQDVTGNRLPRTPDWTVSAGATYARQFTGGTLELKGDLFLSDKFYFDQGNIFAQSAYQNLDASISWTMPSEKLKFTLWGRNLTDEAIAMGSLISTRTAEYRWSPPRTYGITISMKN
jgi:iron complex outermembrane receptor protein